MFLIIFSIILVTAAGVTALIFMVTDNNMLKKCLLYSRREPAILVVTQSGKLIDSQDELQVEIEILNHKLNEKLLTVQESKERINSVKYNLSKLERNKEEVLNHFAGLKYELDKSERDCELIAQKIEDYTLKLKKEDGDVCQKALNVFNTKKVM